MALILSKKELIKMIEVKGNPDSSIIILVLKVGNYTSKSWLLRSNQKAYMRKRINGEKENLARIYRTLAMEGVLDE